MPHCHDEHDHHGHDHSEGAAHDHTDDLTPALQNHIYEQIDFSAINTLNESEPRTGSRIVQKTWTERLDPEPELSSDADEQLLMHIPFTAQIRFHSILIRTSTTDSAPMTLKVFLNRDDLDFSTASSLEPTQKLDLAQTNEVQEVPVKRALFNTVRSLDLFFEDNWGQGEEDVTRISYIGFKGEWMKLSREPVNFLYEAAANPQDHKLASGVGERLGHGIGGGGPGHGIFTSGLASSIKEKSSSSTTIAAPLDARCSEDSPSVAAGATIEVLLGAEKHKFVIHEALIRSHSAFFDVALKNEWKEGQARVVELPEEVAASFGGYANWLYTGKIPSKQADGRSNNRLLIELYVLGEHMMDSDFQDRVLDALVIGMREQHPNEDGVLKHWWPTNNNVKLVYDGTPQGSQLRRLMVDTHLLHGNKSFVDYADIGKSHHEFLVDLTRALLDERVVTQEAKNKRKDPMAGMPCSYHKHDKGKPCGVPTG